MAVGEGVAFEEGPDGTPRSKGNRSSMGYRTGVLPDRWHPPTG
jgi:hypothetical protein